MRVREVIWLPEFEDKLYYKHAVLAEEVEEILFGQPQIRFVEKGHHPGENLYAAYGQTDSGRHLIVFFVLKADARALIISARDMDRKERKLYGREKGQ